VKIEIGSGDAGFVGFGGRWGVDMRISGCFWGVVGGIYFWVAWRWAGAVGLCPRPTHDDETVMHGAPGGRKVRKLFVLLQNSFIGMNRNRFEKIATIPTSR
jgi:hypothetical protein